MSDSNAGGRRRLVWGIVVVLGVLHGDFWAWDDQSLVFGFLPMTLAYQAAFSVACGAIWFCAIRFAWPDELEAWADEEGMDDLLVDLEESGALEEPLADMLESEISSNEEFECTGEEVVVLLENLCAIEWDADEDDDDDDDEDEDFDEL